MGSRLAQVVAVLALAAALGAATTGAAPLPVRKSAHATVVAKKAAARKAAAKKAVAKRAAAKRSGLLRTSASVNLVPNGSFEGSLAGWAGYKAGLSLASDGFGGSGAAKVSLNVSKTSDGFSIYATAPHVRSAVAGTVYSASVSVRSDRPGRPVCVRIRESSAGSKTACVNSTSSWQTVANNGYVVSGSGHAIDVFVYGWNALVGDSFEVDSLSLVQSDQAVPVQAPPPVPTTTTATTTAPTTTAAPPATITTPTVTTPPPPTPPPTPPPAPGVDVAHQLPWYSSGSPFNTPIAQGATVDAGSAAMVQGLVNGAGGGFSIGAREWTTPVYYATPTTPKTNVKLTVSWAPARGLAGVPIPADAKPDPQGDHHLTVLDAATQCEYDFWQAVHNADGSWSASWGNATKLSGTGVYAGGWATTASGFANGIGKIRPEELAAGRINHALVVGIPNTRAGGPVLPATASDGRSSGAGTIPEGAHIQLDPSLDLSTLGLTAWQLTIARALQQYGMFVGDTGGTVGLSAINGNSLPAGSYPWGDGSYASMPTSLLSHMRVLSLGAQYSPTGYLDPSGCATFTP